MANDCMKTNENIYFRCRKEAAKYNDKLNSRESASELLGVSVSEENKRSVLTVYSSVMALFVFGRSTIKAPEPKEEKAVTHSKKLTKRSKKSKPSGVTYILTYSGKEPHIATKGSHSSPQGMFSVRGHYRRYKSGKIIWIAQYTKGTGRKTDKSYRIGRTD